MRRNSWWLAGLCSAGVFAAGGEDKQLSLTIYNRDLALIEHVRPVNFTAGRQRIEFAGVSAKIIPETVSFAASDCFALVSSASFAAAAASLAAAACLMTKSRCASLTASRASRSASTR